MATSTSPNQAQKDALGQAVLFQAADATHHVGNVFREGELPEKSNVHFLHIAGADRPVGFYNLDVIISVGYRVKSPRGTQFRIWATQVLRNGAPASSKGCASLKRATAKKSRAR